MIKSTRSFDFALKKISLFTFLLLLFAENTCGQTTNLKPLNQLINKTQPAWDEVNTWVKAATNPVEVLPKDAIRADSALYQTQVTTRSMMGAVVYETGGILIDHGWIRILGSGHKRLDRSLMEWNKNKSHEHLGEAPAFLLIVDDVLGGFFALNEGALGEEGIGKVFYFAPANLDWEPTDMNYSDFLNFCFTSDLNLFYSGYRWTNWKNEIEALDGNWGMSIFPYLWSAEGQSDINQNSRMPVPMQELWDVYFKKEKN